MAQAKSVGWKRQGPGLQLSPGCPPVPNGSDSLDNNVPKVVSKVTSSGGLPLTPGVPSAAFLHLWSLELPVGAGREESEQEGGKSARSAAALWMAW